MPVIETPFERIAMDFVRPLHWSAQRFRYMLVIMDYASCYPEVLPLRSMQVQRVAQALLHFFS